MKNILVQVTEEEHRKIKVLAAEQGKSIKQLVLEGIEQVNDVSIRDERED